MDYSYFRHDADIGIVGTGPTIEAAFESAARGVFAIAADLKTVARQVHVDVAFDEDDLELALVLWLNRLLGEANARGVVLREFQLRRDGNHWSGRAWGQHWTPDMPRGVEVKGATLTMLSVRQGDSSWEARCIVDV